MRRRLTTAPARLILILLLASAATASGCSRQPDPRSAHRVKAAAATSDTAVAQAEARAVLTTTANSLRQNWYILRAEERLVAGCMRHLGLRYITADAGPEPSAQVVTADAASSSGPSTYGVSLDGSNVGGEPAEDRYVAGLAPGQRARYSALLNGSTSAVGTFTLPSGAVVGYETGGCLGAARQTLFGSVRVQALDDLYPQDVEHRFATFIASNGAYESALRSWRSCMAAAGWRLASPQAAIQAIQALAARPGTTQSELASRQTRAANADAACNARSGLRARVADALAVFVRKLPGAEVLQLQRIYLSRRRAASVAVRDLPT